LLRRLSLSPDGTQRNPGPARAARLGGAAACAAVLLLGSTGLRAQAPGNAPAPAPYVTRPESELLLLALRLQGETLADALPAYPTRTGLLLPFGEVCQLLDLAVVVDVTRGSASGFVIASGRRFLVDVPGRRLVIDGRESELEISSIEVHQDDLYVDARVMSKWLPVDFTVDLYGAVVVARPRETLPIQARRGRAAAAEKTLGGAGLPHYPEKANPYRLFDWPALDESVRVTFLPQEGGGRHLGIQSSTYASADLLWHEANGYLFVDDQGGVSESRLTLGRRDDRGTLLGPLGAREYAVGNVLYPGLETIAQPRSGNGFLLSSFPLDRQSQFDRNTFRGELPSGWDVELYQNGSLVAFQGSRPDGLYEFLDVSLLFGLNVFRLVFYGPQGQRREETRSFNIADSLPAKGRLNYRVVGNEPSGVGRRGHAEAEYGLLKGMSIGASVAGLELDDGSTHRYGRFGLRGYAGAFFGQIDAVADFANGSLVQATVQGRAGALGLLASYATLHDFQSEIFRQQYGQISSRAELRLDATVPKAFLPQIPIVLDARRDRTTAGLDVWEVVNRISMSGGRGFALSNFVDWRYFHGPAAPDETALGDFLVSQVIGTFVLRGEALYDLRPDPRLNTVTATAEKLLAARYLVNAGVSRVVLSSQTHVLAGVSRQEGAFAFGVNLDVASPGGLSAILTVNASFGRDPHTGKWRMQSRPLAGTGAVAPLAFLDANGNGVLDAGEHTLEGVGFQVAGGATPARTAADGTTLLSPVVPYRLVDVGVALGSLEDPLARPSVPGVGLVPRPGRITPLEFPIVIRGEVTGTAYRRRGSDVQPASGVEMQLVDAAGTVVKSSRSAYDGFFDLSDVPPGHYILRTAPEQMQRLGLLAPAPRDIVLEPSGTILDGLDLVIVDAAHPAPEAKAP
jgi:hypothetical protein